MKHTCHAKNCKINVPEKMFMCKRHWYMVPRDLRLAIWALYVPGQEIRKDPTREYLETALEAIDAVAAKEARS